MINTKLTMDINEIMQKLSGSISEETLRAAGFAGAEVFRNEVASKAPKDTGFLSSNVGVVRDTRSSDGGIVQTYLVKVLTFNRKYANTKFNVRKGNIQQDGSNAKTYELTDAFYWRFFEFGTSKMSAKPFIRPSYESVKEEALTAMRKKLSEKIKESFTA